MHAMDASSPSLTSTPQTVVMRGGWIEQARASFGLDECNFVDALTVEGDSSCTLTSEAGQASAVLPIRISTGNIDVYKRWVGVDDDECPPDSAIARRWQLPGPWRRRNIADISELAPDERADLEKAGWAYIFGHSKLVQSYRHVIEQFNAPFGAVVYPLRKLTVRPGGRLVVTGAPAVLLVDDVELHASGQIITYAVCRAHFGRLEKIDHANSGSPHS
jgi:hypothetical protein